MQSNESEYINGMDRARDRAHAVSSVVNPANWYFANPNNFRVELFSGRGSIRNPLTSNMYGKIFGLPGIKELHRIPGASGVLDFAGTTRHWNPWDGHTPKKYSAIPQSNPAIGPQVRTPTYQPGPIGVVHGPKLPAGWFPRNPGMLQSNGLIIYSDTEGLWNSGALTNRGYYGVRPEFQKQWNSKTPAFARIGRSRQWDITRAKRLERASRLRNNPIFMQMREMGRADRAFKLSKEYNAFAKYHNAYPGVVDRVKGFFTPSRIGGAADRTAAWAGRVAPGVGSFLGKVGWKAGIIGMKAFSVYSLASISWEVAKFIAEPMGRSLADSVNKAFEFSASIRTWEMGGNLKAAYLTQGAATERQRAINAISKSQLNARSGFGSEAMAFHQ